MNAALEFHDSEIERLTLANGMLTVSFSEAYIHQSEGQPGVDPGEGYIQAVDLVFSDAVVVGSLECKGDLSDGLLSVGQSKMDLIPVPFKAAGSVSAQLVFKDGSIVSLSAGSVSCQSIGAGKWLESYPGA